MSSLIETTVGEVLACCDTAWKSLATIERDARLLEEQQHAEYKKWSSSLWKRITTKEPPVFDVSWRHRCKLSDIQALRSSMDKLNPERKVYLSTADAYLIGLKEDDKS